MRIMIQRKHKQCKFKKTEKHHDILYKEKIKNV